MAAAGPGLGRPVSWFPRRAAWLSGAALALGLLAQAGVRTRPGAGLALFALGGLALALLPAASPALGPGPWRPPARERWELPFVAGLALLLALVRFWGLADFPAGAHGHEGEMVDSILRLPQLPYLANLSAEDMTWPTLVFYQCAAFAKLLGHSAEVLRLPSAITAWLAALGFYFLVRRLTVPWTAAVAALLFAANPMMLGVGRNMIPSALLILSEVLASYFLLKALQDRQPLSFAAAGGALGLALHGFLPGRAYPGLFAAWFLMLTLLHRHLLPGLRSQAAFWAGALLVASPVLLWAATHWDVYWAHVHGYNSFGAGGARGYLRGLLQELPPYLRAFHVQGEIATADVVSGEPWVDPLSGLLLGLGACLCLALCWRPIPALLLGGALLSLLPAALGAGFHHPTSRRAVMVMPYAYLLAALGLDQLRAGLAPALGRGARWLGAAGLAAALAAHALSVAGYARFLWRPETLGSMNHSAWLAGRLLLREPGLQAHVSDGLNTSVQVPALLPPDRPLRMARGLEGLLSFRPEAGREQIFLAEGLGAAWEGFFRQAYPGGSWQAFPVGAHSAGLRLGNDPANPGDWLVSYRVPASQAAALRGLLLQAPGLAPAKAEVFEPAFAAAHAGRRLRLRGRLLGGSRGSRVRGSLSWSGWSLRLEGRRLDGREANFPAGVLELELEGKVPERASGALPLQLWVDGQDAVGTGGVLAWDGTPVQMELVRGAAAWGGPAALRRKDLVPVRRFADPTELPLPFTLRMRLRIEPPADGDYELSLGPLAPQGRLRLGAQTAYENLGQPGSKPSLSPLRLRAGQAQPLLLEQTIANAETAERYSAVYLRRAGEADWGFLPQSWLRP